MKKTLFIFLLAITAFSCSKSDNSNDKEETQEATLIGRWNVVGFEGSVLYEFTADKRFTMYTVNGAFETVEDLIASGRNGNDYWYEGEKVTIDLNFGNYSTLTPQFRCYNYVIDWLNDDGEIHSTIFREGFDINTCD